MKKYPIVLTIAGSDSIGGAGIQADIKTCCAMGVYAMSIITAVTAQNTQGINSFECISAEMVKAQITSVIDDVKPDAVKIGMLPNAETIKIVASAIKNYQLRNIVIDPVMVATSGDRLSNGLNETFDTLCTELLPLADIITPNIPEAEMLWGDKISDYDMFKLSANEILNKYRCKSILLKGGHYDGLESIDYFVSDHNFTSSLSPNPLILRSKRIDTKNTHGTGCSLSSAIACGLAKNLDIVQSLYNAKDFITNAIAYGAEYSLGHGNGPINHLYKINEL